MNIEELKIANELLDILDQCLSSNKITLSKERIKQLLDYTTNLQEENKRLYSIIKEVREYIGLYCNTDLVLFKELLEILDKENKE